jgi:hypothetical protein
MHHGMDPADLQLQSEQRHGPSNPCVACGIPRTWAATGSRQGPTGARGGHPGNVQAPVVGEGAAGRERAIAAQHHHLEALAHLARQGQQAHLLGEFEGATRLGVGADRVLEQAGQPGAEQELTLGSIAQHVQSGRLGRLRDRGEIDAAGQVHQTGPGEGVEDHLLAVITEQRSGDALRTVERGPRMPVIADPEQPLRQASTDRLHPGLQDRAPFRDIALRPRTAGPLQRAHGPLQFRRGRALGPSDRPGLQPDPALPDLTAVPGEDLHRHRVKDLVRQDHPVDRRLGQGIEPLHLQQPLGAQPLCEQGLLTGPEIGAQLEDPIPGQAAPPVHPDG